MNEERNSSLHSLHTVEFVDQFQYLGRTCGRVNIVAQQTIDERKGHLEFAVGDLENCVRGKERADCC